MENVELQFKNYLASQKLKYTPERRKILEEIFESKNFFDAEELLRRLKQHNKNVSRATVYRTLELLTRLGLVRRVCLGDRSSLYEKNKTGPHTGRLVCLLCGKIEEFATGGIDQLIEDACAGNDFTPQNRCIQISGYCKDCKSHRLETVNGHSKSKN